MLELVLGVTRTPAMERVGLNFEVPGMRVAEPVDVAREGLEQLPNGPVHIAGGNGDDVERRNDPDRAKVVLGTHRFMQKLIGGSRQFLGQGGGGLNPGCANATETQ